MSLFRPALCGALAAICVFSAPSSIVHAATMVRGENRSCRDFADLDFALDHPTSDYFKGWTANDFDAAQAWITACTEATPSARDQTRQSLLAQRREALTATGETARNEQSQAATRATTIQNQEADEAAVRAAVKAQQAIARRYAECARSPAHQRYVAQTRVLEALDREFAAQQALDHEKRVETLSGVTNLSAQRSAAESLVSAQDEEHRWWATYRQNGGNASNPQALAQSALDPCG